MAGFRANKIYVPGFGLGFLLMLPGMAAALWLDFRKVIRFRDTPWTWLLPLCCVGLGLACMNVLHGVLLRKKGDAKLAERITRRADLGCLLAAVVLGAIALFALRAYLSTHFAG